MFTILGADGKPYGPVTADNVRAWITAGRANLQTKAQRAGEVEWKTLGDFSEFNPAAFTGAGAVPPPMPTGGMPSFPATTAFVPPSSAVVPQPELADRGVRLGSFLLDWLRGCLCALPGLLMLGPVFFAAVLAASRHRQPDLSGIAAGGLLMGVAVLCCLTLALLVTQIWLLSTRGQTIGKIITGIKVVRVPDGAPAGFVNGWLLRNFVPGIIRVLPWIGFLFFLVDACFIFGDERRCLHDLIASTKVVKAPKAR